MGFVILAIGLVFVVEGLVIALAPSRMEELLKAIANIPFERRRILGLLALALGIVLAAWGRSLLGL